MNASALTSLLYFLAFGFFFYWMMKRGGCGTHAHGGHGAHGQRSEGEHDEHAGSDVRDHAVAFGATKDPVCGMDVDPKRAAGMRTAMGRTFYFCSPADLAKFDGDPEAFARRAQTEAPSSSHEHHQH
jgi:YHS domain-containing protein